MTEPAIEDAILTRRFDLLDSGTVDIHVWKPVVIKAGSNHACPYRISGLGSGKLRMGHGIDDIQAMSLTLQMIASTLYASDAYRDGSLTWLGGRDLGLPVMPGAMPGSDAYAKADLLVPGGQSAIITIPGDRFAYFALPGERLNGLVQSLEEISKEIESIPAATHTRLGKIAAGLAGERAYFEGVCGQAGVDLEYVKAPTEA